MVLVKTWALIPKTFLGGILRTTSVIEDFNFLSVGCPRPFTHKILLALALVFQCIQHNSFDEVMVGNTNLRVHNNIHNNGHVPYIF